MSNKNHWKKKMCFINKCFRENMKFLFLTYRHWETVQSNPGWTQKLGEWCKGFCEETDMWEIQRMCMYI